MARLFLGLAALFVLPTMLFSQDVGDTVVIVSKDGAKLRSGEKVVGNVPQGQILSIKGLNEKYLLVNADGKKGWIRRNDVLELEPAIEHFSKEIGSVPSASDNYLIRGSIWYKKGEFDKALADFNEAIRLEPSAAAYNNRARVWNMREELDRAISDYSEAIRLDPKYAAAYFNRGVAWNKKKESYNAIADYSEVLRVDSPFAATANFNRGLIWKEMGFPEKAIEDFTEAIRLLPRFPSGYFNRATELRKTGELDLAIVDFTKAIELNPEDAEALYLRGRSWTEKGEYQKALDDFSEVIRLDPDNPFPYRRRAEIFGSAPDRRVRNGSQAVDDAKKAGDLGGWKHWQDRQRLATAYAELRDFDEAVRWQTLAVELAPENSKDAARSRLEIFQSGKPFYESPAAAIAEKRRLPPKPLKSLQGTMITKAGEDAFLRAAIWAKDNKWRAVVRNGDQKIISIQLGNVMYTYIEGSKSGEKRRFKIGLASVALIRQIEEIKANGRKALSERINGVLYDVYRYEVNLPREAAIVTLASETSLPGSWTSFVQTSDDQAAMLEMFFVDMKANVEIPDKMFELPSDVTFSD